jgi:hypothetical protein
LASKLIETVDPMDGAKISPNPRLYPPKMDFPKSLPFVCSFQPILRDKTKMRELMMWCEIVTASMDLRSDFCFVFRALSWAFLCTKNLLLRLSTCQPKMLKHATRWTTLIIHSGGTSNHWIIGHDPASNLDLYLQLLALNSELKSHPNAPLVCPSTKKPEDRPQYHKIKHSRLFSSCKLTHLGTGAWLSVTVSIIVGCSCNKGRTSRQQIIRNFWPSAYRCRKAACFLLASGGGKMVLFKLNPADASCATNPECPDANILWGEKLFNIHQYHFNIHQ